MSLEDRLQWLFWPMKKQEIHRELSLREVNIDGDFEFQHKMTDVEYAETLIDVAPLEQTWSLLVREITESLDAMTSFLTVSVSGLTREKCEPYVQASRGDNGTLLLETVSEHNLETTLSTASKNTLKQLGWRNPNGPDENYYIYLSARRPANFAIAEFMVRTLLDGYGVTSNCKFDYFTE